MDGGEERRGKSLNLTAYLGMYVWWVRRSRKGLQLYSPHRKLQIIGVFISWLSLKSFLMRAAYQHI